MFLEKSKSPNPGHLLLTGKAACVEKLCITPEDLLSRLGEFGQFCPVSLAEANELYDCSLNDSLELVAEFRGHYYKMHSQEKLQVRLSPMLRFVQ